MLARRRAALQDHRHKDRSKVSYPAYADHLPLHRQAQIYARQGIDLDRSTLADWVGQAACHLRPLQDRLLARLKERPPPVCGRDDRARAGSRPRLHQDRAALGLCR